MPMYLQPNASSSKRQLSPSSSWISEDPFRYFREEADNDYMKQLAIAAGVENEARPHSYDRFPIRKYIQECGLPLFRYKGVEALLDEKKLRSSFRWPDILALKVHRRSRGLKEVKRYADYAHIKKDIDAYFGPFEEDTMNCFPPYPFEFLLPFRLPHNKTIVFEDSDCQALNDIQNETEILTLLHRYLFDTLLSAICLLLNLSPLKELDLPKIDLFRFRISNNLFFDRYSKWDIFTLPSEDGNPHTVPLVLIFIHPSDFGIEDFEQLVQERSFENNDVLNRPKDPADVIWAVLYEILKGRGRRFVVTNYVRWAFGQFDQTHEVGYITEIYESRLTNSAGEFTSLPPQQFCNPIELLLRWMMGLPEVGVNYPTRYINPQMEAAFHEMMHHRMQPSEF